MKIQPTHLHSVAEELTATLNSFADILEVNPMHYKDIQKIVLGILCRRFRERGELPASIAHKIGASTHKVRGHLKESDLVNVIETALCEHNRDDICAAILSQTVVGQVFTDEDVKEGFHFADMEDVSSILNHLVKRGHLEEISNSKQNARARSYRVINTLHSRPKPMTPAQHAALAARADQVIQGKRVKLLTVSLELPVAAVSNTRMRCYAHDYDTITNNAWADVENDSKNRFAKHNPDDALAVNFGTCFLVARQDPDNPTLRQALNSAVYNHLAQDSLVFPSRGCLDEQGAQVFTDQMLDPMFEQLVGVLKASAQGHPADTPTAKYSVVLIAAQLPPNSQDDVIIS